MNSSEATSLFPPTQVGQCRQRSRVSRHQRYLERELEMIRAEWAKGKRVKQIAFIIDRDRVDLTTKLSAMGLPLRKQRRSAGWTNID